MFDLISIGDVVVDTFISLIDAQVEVVGGERKLLLPYGDKMPVELPVSVVGGNAANSAVGSSRLKMRSAIYTTIGDDTNGFKVVNTFKKEEVDRRYVSLSKKIPTNHHIVLNFKGERTILDYHQKWEYELPDFEPSKWIYFTSLSPSFVHSSIVSQLTQYLERTNSKLLYNPGTFQIKHGVKRYPRLLSLTEVFILNKEEAKLSLGFDEGEKVPIKKLLKDLVDLGPKMVVITDGGEGSYGFDGERYFQIGTFPARMVEMTGAGDAFASGVLAGLFHGKDLSEAMRWGAANSASVVEEIGPQAGLLTYNGMMEKLKEHEKIVAKEI